VAAGSTPTSLDRLSFAGLLIRSITRKFAAGPLEMPWGGFRRRSQDDLRERGPEPGQDYCTKLRPNGELVRISKVNPHTRP